MTPRKPAKKAAAKKSTPRRAESRSKAPAKDTRPLAPESPLTAVLNARRESQQPSRDWERMCLAFVRTVWGLPARFLTAKDAYEDAKKHGDIHTFKDPNTVPVGAPVFTRSKTAGPNDAGHVFIACRWFVTPEGKRIRIFRSTDIKRVGDVDAVQLQTLLDKWNHECLGWSSSLNGYRLPLKPVKK